MNTFIKTSLVVLMIVGFSFAGFSQRKVSRTVVVKKPVKRTVVVKKGPSKKVVKVKRLPKSRVVIKHKGQKVYVANNRYYVRKNGAYIVTRPSLGLRVKALPLGYRKVVVDRNTFFVYDRVYYRRSGNAYTVVRLG